MDQAAEAIEPAVESAGSPMTAARASAARRPPEAGRWSAGERQSRARDVHVANADGQRELGDGAQLGRRPWWNELDTPGLEAPDSRRGARWGRSSVPSQAASAVNPVVGFPCPARTPASNVGTRNALYGVLGESCRGEAARDQGSGRPGEREQGAKGHSQLLGLDVRPRPHLRESAESILPTVS